MQTQPKVTLFMCILHNTTTTHRFRTPVPQDLRDRSPQANANLAALEAAVAKGVSAHDWYRDLFAAVDVLFLIYRDEDESCGLGYVVAKGRPLMKRAIDADKALVANTTSMIAASKAHAYALWSLFGDDVPAWLR